MLTVHVFAIYFSFVLNTTLTSNHVTVKGMLICKSWGIILGKMTMSVEDVGKGSRPLIKLQLLCNDMRPTVDSLCISLTYEAISLMYQRTKAIVIIIIYNIILLHPYTVYIISYLE